jgi:hypothetical protein
MDQLFGNRDPRRPPIAYPATKIRAIPALDARFSSEMQRILDRVGRSCPARPH